MEERRVMDLTLLDLSSPHSDDASGFALRDRILPSVFANSSTAASFLAAERQQDSSSLSPKLQKDVNFYLKTKDRYMALSSILLKSRAFHQTFNHDDDGKARSLPIVDLPRTDYGKPFIPVSNGKKRSKEEQQKRCPFSVSHQFPFVGVARLVPYCAHAAAKAEHDPVTTFEFVGFDIVVFDGINRRLYKTTQEFLSVFVDVFTPTEFAMIHTASKTAAQAAEASYSNERQIDCKTRHDFVLLREFYLRWAVKEAYTKALGLGLGYDFGGFETKWSCSNNNYSLWEWLSMSSSSVSSEKTTKRRGFLSVGTVVPVVPDEMAPTRKHERWLFHFEPLFGHPKKNAPLQTDDCLHEGIFDSTMRGCACTCIGPLSGSSDDNQEETFAETTLKVLAQWKTLEELMAWHSLGSDKPIL